jgi:hypothetical protein
MRSPCAKSAGLLKGDAPAGSKMRSRGRRRRRTPSAVKASRRISNSLKVGTRPVDDGDARRRRGAAPFATAGDQRLEQRLDRPVEAGVEALAESRHRRIAEKSSASPTAAGAPVGDSPLYSANCSESGRMNASARAAVLRCVARLMRPAGSRRR